MSPDSAHDAFRDFRTLYSYGSLGGLTDDQLLRHFLNGGQALAEAAFRALVERHGPMVLGVCRRILNDRHAAEDAFQATFLVLIRRAGSVGESHKLGNWLYGVAVRASREARRRDQRRMARERTLRIVPSGEPEPADERQELLSILDEELSQLPGRYREALVACELEGKTRREAADLLGLPEGTLSSHLARGRKLLRERLGRRGIGISTTPWPLLQGSPSADLASTPLVDSTMRFAGAFVSGTDVTRIVPASVATLLTSMRRTTTMAKITTATASCILVGALTLAGFALAQSNRDPEAPPTAAPKPQPETSEKPSSEQVIGPDGRPFTNKRSLRVQVLGPDGKPMPKVQLHISVWSDKPDKTLKRDYESDTEGQADLALPQGLQIVRVWARAEGFVPMFAGWEESERPEVSLPRDFTFKLRPGTTIGGKICDESGKPIEGVKVDVKLKSGGQSDGKAGPDDFLAENQRTDAEGHWTIHCVPPGDDVEVELNVTHANYISDKYWGSLQRLQKVTTRDLRSQRAVIKLKAGVEVTGQVADPTGKPVSRAVVVWGDRPYFELGSQEVRTDASGHFRLPALQPGPYTLTVVAKDWMPYLTKLEFQPGIKPVSVRLQPGKELRIHCIDPDGKAIPDVNVSIDSWKGGESLYNYKHPNVLDTQIPTESNSEGRYAWSWAPDDLVKYRFWKEGFASEEAELTADGQDHAITLKPVLQITGKVTDAVTGKPIQPVVVIPVLESSIDLVTVDRQDIKTFDANTYRIEGDRTDVSYRVRVEAQGYRAAISDEVFRAGTKATYNFKLLPAAPIKGQVVDRQGKPVKDAKVILGTASQTIYLPNLEDSGLPSPTCITTGDGSFSFHADYEDYALMVIHKDGYGEISRRSDQPAGDIELKPWARIEGRVMQGGRPVPSVGVTLEAIRSSGSRSPRIQDSLGQTTDVDGRFVMTRVPPMAASLSVATSIWRDSPISFGRAVPLDIQPGQKIEVDLGGEGATLKGKVVLAPGGPTIDLHKSINYLVRRGSGIKPPEAIRSLGFRGNGGWNPAWRTTQEGRTFLNTLDHTMVTLDVHGQFAVSGLKAGEYDLAIHLYEPPSQGCLTNPVGTTVVKVSIPDSAGSSNPIDLGEIKVETKLGPRVGDPAPEIDSVDASGTKGRLSGLKGKYVLIDFWATWCGQCVSNLSTLKTFSESFANRKDVVILGLNLDEDREKAMEFIGKQDLRWQHGFLTPEASETIQSSYAISSLPTYLLIDPEGKILNRAVQLDDAVKALKEALK